MSIKSFYQFAQLSIEEKKGERYEQVITESADFLERFPQSSFAKEVEQYLSLSQNNLKNITNEPSKTPA
jgi:outer membrane protein assembly factor BamD